METDSAWVLFLGQIMSVINNYLTQGEKQLTKKKDHVRSELVN